MGKVQWCAACKRVVEDCGCEPQKAVYVDYDPRERSIKIDMPRGHLTSMVRVCAVALGTTPHPLTEEEREAARRFMVLAVGYI